MLRAPYIAIQLIRQIYIYHKKKLVDITLHFLNIIVLFFPLVYVSQPFIKTLFLADGSNMDGSSSVLSTSVPLFFRARPFSFSEKTGETLTTLANPEYPGWYCKKPYRRFYNVNLIRGGRK